MPVPKMSASRATSSLVSKTDSSSNIPEKNLESFCARRRWRKSPPLVSASGSGRAFAIFACVVSTFLRTTLNCRLFGPYALTTLESCSVPPSP